MRLIPVQKHSFLRFKSCNMCLRSMFREIGVSKDTLGIRKASGLLYGLARPTRVKKGATEQGHSLTNVGHNRINLIAMHFVRFRIVPHVTQSKLLGFVIQYSS